MQDRIATLVKREISSIRPLERKELLEKQLVLPIAEQRQYATAGGSETGVVWIIARVDADVGLGYSEDGYGAEGSPWGLVFLAEGSHGSSDGSWYGSSGSWYRTLQELVDDCGYY